MDERHSNKKVVKQLLPYFLTLVGFILTLNFFFLNVHFDSSWLIIIIGFCLSTALGTTIYYYQKTKHQTEHLKLMIIQLKSEMAERISVEKSKRSLETVLLQGQKLQSLGTLASGIAHDFNNILYAIAGFTTLAREDIDKDSVAYQNLCKVIAATKRGQDLIGKIMTFGRKQTPAYEVLNLKKTIELALSLLKPTIPSSVIFHMQLNEVYLWGNQTEIHQIFINLINNAVHAMNGEGLITIKLIKYVRDNPRKHFCKVNITDTGSGMDKSTLDRIFEPFYTTKEVGSGTGLGLSIVHNIIKQHQGEITVASEIGKGTSFTLLFPEYTMEG